MKDSLSKKPRWPTALLLLVMILQVMIVPSFAWSGIPLCNKVNVFIGDTQIIRADESIRVDSGAYIPASVLCGDMVYLSIDQLMVSGITFSVDEKNSVIGVDGVDFNARLLMLPTRQDTGNISLGANFLANATNLNASGRDFARIGNWIEYDGDTFPSSFMTDETIYIPIGPMLQQTGVDIYFDISTLTMYIGSTAPVQQVGLSNFEVVNHYYPGRFTDVTSSAWYNQKVGTAYEYGLMTGSSTSTFNPNGNISVAEAITTACQLHSTYYKDNYQFQATTPWYQTYVNYALSNEIITTGYSNYTAPITRAEFAVILANALPSEALTAINHVEMGAIPDVPSDSNYYNAVYSLYRAGIISGSDSRGTFDPNSNITRAEAATILCNMVDTNSRALFSLQKAPAENTNIEEFHAFYQQYGEKFISLLREFAQKPDYMHNYYILTDFYADISQFLQTIDYTGNNKYILEYLTAANDIKDGTWMYISGVSNQDNQLFQQGGEKMIYGLEKHRELLRLLINAGYSS